jgi:sortase (surface protein transpeptidase)
MAPRVPFRRSLVPFVLAVAFTAGSSIATTALGPGPTRPSPTPGSPASVAIAAHWTTTAPRGPRSAATRPGLYRFPRPLSARAVAAKIAQPKAAPKPKATPKPKAAPKPKPARVTPRPVTRVTVGSAYKGRNHAWIPAIGVNRSVGWYACGATKAPGLGLYRWGCAGANNVYLLAHAYSAFRGLHDAYVSGRLRKGMRATYADPSGRVRTYAVVWWRLTTPDNGAFAYAAQSRPSMTLQTCVGARSQYRLIVRLVAVG